MTPTSAASSTAAITARRFFTSFYDVVSALRPGASSSPSSSSFSSFSSTSSSTIRQFSTRARPHHRVTPHSTSNTSYYYNFLGAAAANGASTQWGPKGRYVVTRSFAGFCAWTTVPGSTTATAAVSKPTQGGVKEAASAGDGTAWARWGRLRMMGARIGIRGLHTERRQRGTGKTLGHVRLRRWCASSGRGRRGNGNGKREKEKEAVKEREKEAVRKEEVLLNQAPKTPREQRMLDRITNVHRPTKDEMLAAATGMWQRLRIRTKWSLIRQMRPYNWEDISAFFSWLVLGHVVWIVVGTTTFVGVVVALVNSVVAQETLAGAIGNYLTRETGIKVVFESAIVPKWKDNKISFHNVFVSRRPHKRHSSSNHTKNVQKGSAATAAAAAAAAVTADSQSHTDHDDPEDDGNYTQFDVTIETVSVTLSFARWMNGKGLLKEVELKGVRGVIDRTHVVWEEGMDPRDYKHHHQPGDFEIESFSIEDLLVTVHQPDGFRPFPVSIFSLTLPQLRKQWLFYDFLSATNCSGSYDDSLFTIHPRQSHAPRMNGTHASTDSESPQWKKTSRLRIDGLNIDHLNRGVAGPFGWIQYGTVDITADVLFPPDPDDLHLSKLVQDIYEQINPSPPSPPSATPTEPEPFVPLLNQLAARLPPNLQRHLPPSLLDTMPSTGSLILSSSARLWDPPQQKPDHVILDFYITLNDVRAVVPVFTRELSYVNNALIRPIVAYINSRKTSIPVRCRVGKNVREFDGSWTVYDSGLMDEISAETYEAFARNVSDQQARRRRMKKVGLWSLQLMAQMLLMAMAGTVA